MGVWNFSAGPAKLPKPVLEQASSEMLDWNSSGISVMEMSHRSAEYEQILQNAISDFKDLLGVPEGYSVLFMQGGATAQNALIPLNILGSRESKKAGYVLTGTWSIKSHKEATKYGDISVVASNQTDTEIDGVRYKPGMWMPEFKDWELNPNSSYVHLCSNETISGLELKELPNMKEFGFADVPMVVDMSSHILSRPVNFDGVGIIYAGAQKNLGPAGVTVLIVRDDLLGFTESNCPSVFNYENVKNANSGFNTPPTYAIYICSLVFQWLRSKGGLLAIHEQNIAKARTLYDLIDKSNGFYKNEVQTKYRSDMNVTFTLPTEELHNLFLKETKANGLLGLKGHKSVGGIRASIYNAMPIDGVKALAEFMDSFLAQHG
ncbi:3-phosphoserine/phosphohydroxythreonine transaminase [Taylorella equigenitalis]|uniref:3-phosphoserine/phosphohydroxythreonine transaminase n=1 Tax=Taylorella equigenitalis TaxID=29575 RepID=UPI0023B1BF37|nr:3-phosphoserine/phosphohydroxythreonine transaminase [Taylorella equigenitalis]WEE00921.1 3-phosphoserine/phosphohydroxythreonine transaminase [Taylorella equigenitalis]WEE02399.1 3-phosphoserine/phosphohydroxythreonine transaminase [Taylorella equigenitalis]WFD78938.1 3-phosphoserine/phosphohydroxythreonine transaminase [Taylorella equigenitalis]WFD80412.1 3-phosphoserine/phosphohydroxythreonine transaminase [Taylorella equigenitalis]WFD81891.1 3-phosphoserine/phosphohydroxythreonine trans